MVTIVSKELCLEMKEVRGMEGGGRERERERVCVCVCERERERERSKVNYTDVYNMQS